MIAAFFHCASDVARLHDLLTWIGQLGGCKRHGALLVADAATPYAECRKAKELAAQAFGEVRCISNGKSVTGWPAGPNSLFRAASEYIAGKWPCPFLIVETDCVPLKPNWLDAIESEYARANVSFMGCHYTGRNTATGEQQKMMSGIAVYPASGSAGFSLPDNSPWDMANRDMLLADSVHTPLIWHFYGLRDLPPTFDETKALPNVMVLDQIPSAAVLFHRCKDGSLIRLLRKRMGIETKPAPTVQIVYVTVPNSPHAPAYAQRFLTSMKQFPPGVSAEVVAVANGGNPKGLLAGILQQANVRIHQRTNLGWDIGAYLELSHQTEADLMMCCGESVYFHRAGWLKRITDEYGKYGPGIYGCYSSFLVRPHLPTTAFAVSPLFLRQYPRVVDKKGRYNFEHGSNSFWLQIKMQGGATKLVTWDGAWDQPEWRSPENILWSGDQSNCLVFCNHTDRYNQGDFSTRMTLEHGADGTKRLVPAK